MTKVKKATVISTSVASILAIMKLSIGIASGSVAVLASAIDSVLDMFVSIFNYFAISNSEKPADHKFNYGKGKIEAIASVVEGVIIITSGVFLLYTAIKKYFTNETSAYLEISLIVMVISSVFTMFLVLYLNFIAKETNNMVIKADALHYKTDLYVNISVFVSISLVWLTKNELIDIVVGVAIAIYIIYSAYELVHDGVLMLLDRAIDKSYIKKIEQIINNQNLVTSFHYLKTRQSGNDIFVDVHMVFDDKILLKLAHEISDEVEENITKIDDKFNWIINIHLDPEDDSL